MTVVDISVSDIVHEKNRNVKGQDETRTDCFNDGAICTGLILYGYNLLHPIVVDIDWVGNSVVDSSAVDSFVAGSWVAADKALKLQHSLCSVC